MPGSAARRGTRPRGSWAGRHQAERDGSEQCPFRATRRQLDADARDVLDHARADLDQALPDGRELASSAGSRRNQRRLLRGLKTAAIAPACPAVRREAKEDWSR